MKYFTLSFIIHILAVASISSSIAGNSQQNYEVYFESLEQKNQVAGTATQKKSFAKTHTTTSTTTNPSASSSPIENKSNSETENTSGVVSLNGQTRGAQSLFSYLVSQIYQNRIYPYESIRLKQQGQVTVNFDIDQNGEITNVQLANPCLHKLLNQAAIKTLDRIKLNKSLPEVEKLFNRSYSFTFDFELTKAAST